MRLTCIGGPLHGQQVDGTNVGFHAHDEADNCRIVFYRKRQFYVEKPDAREHFDFYIFQDLDEGHPGDLIAAVSQFVDSTKTGPNNRE